MRPLISVIIPCYNTSKYLLKGMQSLENQTIGLKNLQLIFVDDASTDNGRTWDCILDFEKRHPREVVAIHLEQNRSQGGARNEGLKYAQAEYVGFMDSDDWIEPDMYLQLYECMERHHCDVVDCRIIMDMTDCQIVYPKMEDRYDRRTKSIMEGGADWWKSFVDNNRYGGGIVTGLYRKAMILDNQVWFPEHLKYEDNYWVAVLLLYVKDYYHLSGDYYHYRLHGESTTHVQNLKHYREQLEIEERKLDKYKELGIFEKHKDWIEYDFLDAYCRILTGLLARYDEPPVEFYWDMAQKVRDRFPDYEKNPCLEKDSINQILIDLIGKQIGEEQFREIGGMVKEYCSLKTELEFWRNRV